MNWLPSPIIPDYSTPGGGIAGGLRAVAEAIRERKRQKLLMEAQEREATARRLVAEREAQDRELAQKGIHSRWQAEQQTAAEKRKYEREQADIAYKAERADKEKEQEISQGAATDVRSKAAMDAQERILGFGGDPNLPQGFRDMFSKAAGFPGAMAPLAPDLPPPSTAENPYRAKPLEGEPPVDPTDAMIADLADKPLTFQQRSVLGEEAGLPPTALPGDIGQPGPVVDVPVEAEPMEATAPDGAFASPDPAVMAMLANERLRRESGSMAARLKPQVRTPRAPDWAEMRRLRGGNIEAALTAQGQGVPASAQIAEAMAPVAGDLLGAYQGQSSKALESGQKILSDAASAEAQRQGLLNRVALGERTAARGDQGQELQEGKFYAEEYDDTAKVGNWAAKTQALAGLTDVLRDIEASEKSGDGKLATRGVTNLAYMMAKAVDPKAIVTRQDFEAQMSGSDKSVWDTFVSAVARGYAGEISTEVMRIITGNAHKTANNLSRGAYTDYLSASEREQAAAPGSPGSNRFAYPTLQNKNQATFGRMPWYGPAQAYRQKHGRLPAIDEIFGGAPAGPVAAPPASLAPRPATASADQSAAIGGLFE